MALGYDSAKGILLRLRIAIAISFAALFVLASCGGNDESDGSDGNGDTGATSTADIDICALLSDQEISAAIGSAPASEPTEPAGPFTGCKWGSGLLYVQIAPATTLITAPGEADCESAGIGDESTMCFGSVKFLTNGIHASISTIENVTLDQLLAVATTLVPKLQE
jgi:hypothetical protein